MKKKKKSPGPGGHNAGPNWFMVALIEPFSLQLPFFFLGQTRSYSPLPVIMQQSACSLHINPALKQQKGTIIVDMHRH